MECVRTVNYTIMVNGEPTDPFNAKKGLRQGDPMYPFLFAIAMEYLSRTLKEMAERKQYHYHFRCAKLKLTHLCFADDLLIFSRGDVESVTEVLQSFNQFSDASGLQSYWAQLFIFPTKVMKDVESFCRSYLWTGNNVITKKALISWERVCCPERNGGWNLINMRIWNKAAIIKLYWNLQRKRIGGG
ncbi:uncharacterized protein LOC142176929 [Nicotiana tabacum]|uniref:Uncharacterized protein LOC142176929 n=1 Tax=Nicotiana tabacum TaxID=4097 RepID=A0AC58TVR1_TOBAC